MAQAIIRGGLDAGVMDPTLIGVVEPDGARRDVFRSWGVRAVKHAQDLLHWLRAAEGRPGAGQLLLAVKPQSLEEVGGQLRPWLGLERRITITILAGTPSHRVHQQLGQAGVVVRVMPNTPARIRRATTAVALGVGAVEGDQEMAIHIFSALGRVVRIDESLMDAFTAVAGSGPAYVFYLAEAMTAAAMRVGFDHDTAAAIVRWTVTGSAALLDATDQPPEALRAAVTSKGGTTAAAVAVLDAAQVKDAMARAIAAARDRGAELGRLA